MFCIRSSHFEYYESESSFFSKACGSFSFIILIEKLMLLIEHSFDYQIVNRGPPNWTSWIH